MLSETLLKSAELGTWPTLVQIGVTVGAGLIGDVRNAGATALQAVTRCQRFTNRDDVKPATLQPSRDGPVEVGRSGTLGL